MIEKTEQEIMKNWKGNINKPVVSVCCITYNHEKYIAEALDSFLMQETDFPFEVIVRDDASPDKTANIIREYEAKYPKIIKPIYEKENGYSKGIKAGAVTYKKAIGEYIAFCEGDDYWICKDKLQKQVDFLETNSECLFCWTRFKTFDDKTKVMTEDMNTKYFNKKNTGVEFGFEKFCITGWHIGMQTLVFRKKALDLEHTTKKEYRDVFMLSNFLDKGKGYCLSDFCAVYRVHDGGIHSGTSSWNKIVTATKIYKEVALTFPHREILKEKYFRYSNELMIASLIRGKFSFFIEELKNRSEFQHKIKAIVVVSIVFTKKTVRKFLNLFTKKA